MKSMGRGIEKMMDLEEKRLEEQKGKSQENQIDL